MKGKVLKSIDSIALWLCIWILCLIIARYFITSFFHSCLVALVISMGLMMLLMLRTSKNQKRQLELDKAKECVNHFIYFDVAYALDYFFNALKAKYDVTKKSNFLRVRDTMIIPSLFESLKLKTLVEYYATALREGATTLVVLTPSKDISLEGIKERLSQIRVEIFEADRVYSLLKSLEKLPEITPKTKLSSRQKRKELARAAFNPRRAKGYLFSCLVLLPGAYFSLFPFYFLFFAGLSLAMAVLCKLGIYSSLSSTDSLDSSFKGSKEASLS